MTVTPTPTPEDYAAAEAIQQRRATDPLAEPTREELAAINRVLVEQARERMRRDGRLPPEEGTSRGDTPRS